ncbi:hypothetical protein JCM11641_003094 [Rhodosporidiobolus odoratus]
MPRQRRAATLNANYAEEPYVDSDEDQEEEVGDKAGKPASKLKSRSSTGADTDEEEEWSAGLADDEPVKKKSRTTAKGKGKGKGKQGKLAAFQSLPMDLIVEISRYLDPLTLLNMSRANKSMHNVFASRSAAPIWSIVRANVYLPTLTASDMTDLQYASLVFERECHMCGCGRAVIVDYALHRRWCKACQKANVMQANKVKRELGYIDSSTLKCSLVTTHNISGTNYNRKPYYCKHDVNEVNKVLADLKADIAQAKGTTERAEKYAALEAYIKGREAIVAAAPKDAELLVKWERSSLVDRKEANRAACAARKAAIVERLVELGHGKQDTDALWSVSDLVNQPAALTNTIWNRISTRVIACVEQNKTNRLARESDERRRRRRGDLRPYYDNLLQQQDTDKKSRYPSFEAFVQLPSVETFWEPEGDGVDQQSWNDAQEAIDHDVDVAIRVLKVKYARTVVRALIKCGASLDEDLAKRLSAAAAPTLPTPVYDSSYYHDATLLAKLNLTDTAASIAKEELDGILSRFLSHFRCSSYRCDIVLPYPEIQEHSRSHPEVGLQGSDIPATWVKQLIGVLKTTGYEDEHATTDKLKALGPVWTCYGCENERAKSYSPWMFSGRDTTVASRSLTWDEISKHYFQYHVVSYLETSVKIILEPAGQAALEALREVGGAEASSSAAEGDGERKEGESAASGSATSEVEMVA